ncbi:MAG: YdcF family protein [Nitrospira sp.]|nr:YdcF family protein [Nitrospira sp.]MCP9442320.1 YdcF family protein [Nitrospira sp.]
MPTPTVIDVKVVPSQGGSNILKVASAVAVAACCVGLALWSFVKLGEWLAGPQNSPHEADVIVVLGGGDRPRVQRALDLYRQGYARWILLAGTRRAENERGDQWHHWRARWLLAQEVPKEAILFDDRSHNSYEEARHAAALMHERNWKSALVVSDPPHLRRLELIWHKVASQYGIEYRLVASEPPTWNAARWWEEKVWAKFVGMELVKLAYYAVVY